MKNEYTQFELDTLGKALADKTDAVTKMMNSFLKKRETELATICKRQLDALEKIKNDFIKSAEKPKSATTKKAPAKKA